MNPTAQAPVSVIKGFFDAIWTLLPATYYDFVLNVIMTLLCILALSSILVLELLRCCCSMIMGELFRYQQLNHVYVR